MRSNKRLFIGAAVTAVVLAVGGGVALAQSDDSQFDRTMGQAQCEEMHAQMTEMHGQMGGMHGQTSEMQGHMGTGSGMGSMSNDGS